MRWRIDRKAVGYYVESTVVFSSLAVSTLDSRAVDRSSNPGSSKL